MSYDFFAQYPISNQQQARQLDMNMHPYSRILLLGSTLLSRDKDKIRQTNYKSELKKLVTPECKSLMADLNIDTPDQLDLSRLPFSTFSISFQFQLTRPYISRDDEAFYIIDNPVIKDKVFKRPMVRPSGWKGALRHAIRLKQNWDDNHPQLRKLFGSANEDNQDDSNRGPLYFYPSFFDSVDLEIINPHDRQKKAGKNPILIESVPPDTTGTFTLLYAPLDRIGEDKAETRCQAMADLRLVAEGLQAMFTVYGFGAKTSSGFGVADVVETGQVALNVPDEGEPAKPRPTEPDQPEIVSRFLTQYPDEDFQRKPQAWRKARGATSGAQKQYREAKAAYQDYQQRLQAYEEAMATYETEQQEPKPPVTKRQFGSFEVLVEMVKKLNSTEGATYDQPE